MWLSKKIRGRTEAGGDLAVGTVTIGGASAAVMTGCEYRSTALFGPAGLAWLPGAGSSVLVVKTPVGRAVAGAAVESGDLAPGEVMLYAEGCSVRLSPDGVIRLTGRVFVNGAELGV